MRSLIVFACLLALYAAQRPSSFESDRIIVDEEGFYKSNNVRRSDPRPEDMLEYKVRFHKNVINLDKIPHITSIKCLAGGDLVIQITPGSKIEQWKDDVILFGGKEWGCRGESGKATRFAVKPSSVTVLRENVYVHAVIAEQKEVYETLQMGWRTPHSIEDETSGKRDWRNKQWNTSLTWNLDPKTNRASGPIKLLSVDCGSFILKAIPQLKAICDKGAQISMVVTCVDCWAKYKMNVTFVYDQDSGKKNLDTMGNVKMNITVEVKTTFQLSHDIPNAFAISQPFVQLGVPGVADIDVDFTVAIDLTLKWNVVGAITSGSYIEGNYVMGVGSDDREENFELTPTPTPPTFKSYGDGTVQTTLRAGPHFKVHLLLTTFFDAFTELAPFAKFNIHYEPKMIGPKDMPNPKAWWKEPWMFTACKKRHFAEWAMTFGVQVNVGAKGPLIPSSWNKNYLHSEWDLAAGCILPVNGTLISK